MCVVFGISNGEQRNCCSKPRFFETLAPALWFINDQRSQGRFGLCSCSGLPVSQKARGRLVVDGDTGRHPRKTTGRAERAKRSSRNKRDTQECSPSLPTCSRPVSSPLARLPPAASTWRDALDLVDEKDGDDVLRRNMPIIS